jgi:hypothetical protein
MYTLKDKELKPCSLEGESAENVLFLLDLCSVMELDAVTSTRKTALRGLARGVQACKAAGELSEGGNEIVEKARSVLSLLKDAFKQQGDSSSTQSKKRTRNGSTQVSVERTVKKAKSMKKSKSRSRSRSRQCKFNHYGFDAILQPHPYPTTYPPHHPS